MTNTYDKNVPMTDFEYQDVDHTNQETVLLDSFDELRIEVGDSKGATVKLEEGIAEYNFGARLPYKYAVYLAPGTKTCIFTWYGAKITISGTKKSYKSEGRYMEQYLLAHDEIQEERNRALEEKEVGPSVLICGSPNSGKTTACKILLNYALCMGNTPIYVDLNVDNNEIVPPGCIGAAKMDTPLPDTKISENTLCFYTGQTSDSMIYELYNRHIDNMAELVNNRLQSDINSFKKENLLEEDQTSHDKLAQFESYVKPFKHTLASSGVIINAMNVKSEESQESLIRVAEKFKVSTIIVLDYEKMLNEMKTAFPDVKVVEMTKSSGVLYNLDRQAETRRRFDHYYNGMPGFYNHLDSFDDRISLDDYKLY